MAVFWPKTTALETIAALEMGNWSIEKFPEARNGHYIPGLWFLREIEVIWCILECFWGFLRRKWWFNRPILRKTLTKEGLYEVL